MPHMLSTDTNTKTLLSRLHSSTVSLKGRVACEMNTCDELLATEVLFQNILEPLNPPEIAALLSAFVFQVSSLMN